MRHRNTIWWRATPTTASSCGSGPCRRSGSGGREAASNRSRPSSSAAWRPSGKPFTSARGLAERSRPSIPGPARKSRCIKLTEQTAEFLIDGNILYGIKGAPYRVGKSNVAGSVELYALDLDKGAMIWSKHIANEYTGGTFAVKGDRLVLPQQGWVDLPGRRHRGGGVDGGRAGGWHAARRRWRPRQGGSKGQENRARYAFSFYRQRSAHDRADG